MNHVSSEEVLKIHDLVLTCYGGCPGCSDPERISALLARVQNYEFYEGLSDVFALAAMYWVSIAKGHVFVDGNKRTAVAVCLLFLRRNGIVPYNRPDLEDVAVKVAADEMSTTELTEYLRSCFAN